MTGDDPTEALPTGGDDPTEALDGGEDPTEALRGWRGCTTEASGGRDGDGDRPSSEPRESWAPHQPEVKSGTGHSGRLDPHFAAR